MKADAAALRFQLKAITRNGPEELLLIAYPPKGKDKPETLKGVIQFGSTFIPVQIDRSELAQIDQKTAIRPTGGFADFKAAAETKDPEDRMKDLEEILKTYKGKPIVFMAASPCWASW